MSEKVPKVDEVFLWLDDEGDWTEGTIAEVGERDPATGYYDIEDTDGIQHPVFWADFDQCWVDADSEESDSFDDDEDDEE